METLDENVKQEIIPGQKMPLTPSALKGMIFGFIAIGTSGFIIVGIIFGILAISASKRDMPTVNSNPVGYKSSGSMLKAARICGLIGLILSVVYIPYYIFVLPKLM
jgi:hypothetical protein